MRDDREEGSHTVNYCAVVRDNASGAHRATEVDLKSIMSQKQETKQYLHWNALM